MKWFIYLVVFFVLSIVIYEIIALFGFLLIGLSQFEITEESFLLLKFWERTNGINRILGFRWFAWISAISSSLLIIFTFEEDF